MFKLSWTSKYRFSGGERVGRTRAGRRSAGAKTFNDDITAVQQSSAVDIDHTNNFLIAHKDTMPGGSPARAGASALCTRCQYPLCSSRNLKPGLRNSPRIRRYHPSAPLCQQPTETQALPLGDFYTDLLTSPIPRSSKYSSQNPPPPPTSTTLPTFAQSGDATKEDRARLLFGNMHTTNSSRYTSTSPSSTWRTIHGVPIPPRPTEPDNCCMSGCMHCVWDDYRDDIELWATRVTEAQAKVHTRSNNTSSSSTYATPKLDMPRPEVAAASGSMDEDGGGSEGLWSTPSSEAARDGGDLFAEIPVGIREFMATEKKIRDRKRARKK